VHKVLSNGWGADYAKVADGEDFGGVWNGGHLN